MLKITAIQTRMKTPNYYLFRDFSKVMLNSKRISEFRAEISGFNTPCSIADYLICFGGEEFQTPFNIAELSYADKSLLWVTEDPYEIETNTKNEDFFDYIFTTDEKSIGKYKKSASFFPLATPKELFYKLNDLEKEFDIFLFGSLWPNRISILEQMVSELPLTKYRILLVTSQLDASWVDQQKAKEIFSNIENYNGRVLITRRPFNLRQLKHFAQISKLCLNWPRKFVGDKWSVPGPRIFEIASSGTLQLIDTGTQPGVKSLIPHGSYIHYDTNSLMSTLQEHLIETQISEDSGLPLFEFVKENHTWDKRVSSLLDLFEKEHS